MREWELTQHDGACMIVSGPYFDDMIHVIEKSALTELAKENAELKAKAAKLRESLDECKKLCKKLAVECICGEINARHCPVHNEVQG